MSSRRKVSSAALDNLSDDGSDNSSKRSSRRESRRAVAAGQFKEAESDDEFANEHFCLPSKSDKSKSSAERKGRKSKKNIKVQNAESNSKKQAADSSSDSESSDDGAAEGPEYRIEFILGTKVCSPEQWRGIGDGMNTYEVTRGSVWQQPDEEYFCDLHGQTADITKYLIKWQHASFIHCSWETEKDLMEMCHGSSGSGADVKNTHVSNHLKKFLLRCAAREDLWEDLGATEWFLPSFTVVERVLDVDDRENPVGVVDMDWRCAQLPPRELLPAVDAETEVDAGVALNDSNQSCFTDDDETDLAALLMDGENSESQPSPCSEAEEGVESMLTGDMFMSPGHTEVVAEEAEGGTVALTAVFDEESPKVVVAEVVAWDDEKEDDFLDVMGEGDSDDSAEGLICDEPEPVEPQLEQVSVRNRREPKAAKEPVAAPEPTRQSSRRRNSSIKAQEAAASLVKPEKSEKRAGRTHKTRTRAAPGNKPKASSRKNRLPPGEVYLHSNNCWLTVKWAGLNYSEVTQEDVNDLRNSFFVGEEAYTEPLRQFFRREQMASVTRHPLKRQLQESTLTNTIAQIKALEQHTAKLALAEDAGESMDMQESAAGSGGEPDRLVLGGNLRDYQWEGVKWMLFNYSQRRNSILADEMGLGKTIQSAAFLQLLKSNFGLRGPFLVVAPLSTIVQWQREIGLWTDLDVVIYHGSQEDRQLIRDLEFRYVGGLKKDRKDGFKVEVVVTTPETAVAFDVFSSASGAARPSSKRLLSQGIFWEMVIIDEAHKLKNSDSKLTTVLKDEYSYRNCLLLTGTPIQNNTEELHTLLSFVDKERFCDKESFMREFGNISEFSQLNKLHEKLRPYILRREKDNVEKTVPPKEEVVIEVELTVVQKQYYRAIYEQNTAFLYKGQARDGPRLSNLAMELRKCCLHPFLIKGAQTELSKHYDCASGEYTTLETLINTSGKLTLLDKLLPKLQADGHRVLIFSQFRMMLDLIEDYLYNKKCFTYDRIDGSITGRKRQAAIDRYMGRSRTQGQTLEDGTPAPPQSEIFCMLLSTRAGGVGINLTAADTVILFDSDWNPQNDLQAQARAHRIGQTRFVKVYRLLTRGTYEMLMFKAASMKLGLDYAVMNGCNAANAASTANILEGGGDEPQVGGRKRKGRQSTAAAVNALEHLSTTKGGATASSLSKKELEYLLKHGAYDMFKEERDGEAEASSKRFGEESIDDILRRSATFSHADPAEGVGDRSFQQGQGMRGFSKASFVMSGEAEGDEGQGNANYDDIDINDDDFWSKVVGLASGLNDDDADVDGHRSKVQRRNCRAKTDGFYKEPTSSIARLLQDNDKENDSDSDAEDGRGGGRRVLKPIEWTDVQCNKLLQVLATNGGFASEKVLQTVATETASTAETSEEQPDVPAIDADEDEEQILEGWDLIGHEFKVPRGVQPVSLSEIRTMSQKLVLQLLYNSFRGLLPAVGAGGCALAITQVTVNDKSQGQVQLANVSSQLSASDDAEALTEFELAVITHLRRYRVARTVLCELLAAAEGDGADTLDFSGRLSFNEEWKKLCLGGPVEEEGLAASLLRDDCYCAPPVARANDADVASKRGIARHFVQLVESFDLPVSFTSVVGLPSSIAASTSVTDLTNVSTDTSAVPVQAVSSSINRWSRGHHYRLLLLEDLFELHLLRRFSGSDTIREDVVVGVNEACGAGEVEVTRCLLQDLDDVQYYHLLGDSYSNREAKEKDKDGKDGVRRKKDLLCADAVRAAEEAQSGGGRLDVRKVVRHIKDALAAVRGTLEADKVLAEEQRLTRERETEEQLAAAVLRAARAAEEKAEKEALKAQEKAEKEALKAKLSEEKEALKAKLSEEKEALKAKLAEEKAAAAAEKEAVRAAAAAAKEVVREQKQAEQQAALELKINRKYVLAVVKCMGKYGRPRGLYDYMRAKHGEASAAAKQLDQCLISWEQLYRLVDKQTSDSPSGSAATGGESGADACEDSSSATTEQAVENLEQAVDAERMAKLRRIVVSVLGLQSNPRAIYTARGGAEEVNTEGSETEVVFDTAHPLYPACNTTGSSKGSKDSAASNTTPVPGSQPLSAVLPCVDGIYEKMDSMFRLRAVLLVFGSNSAVDHEANAVSSNYISNSLNSAATIAASIGGVSDSAALSATAPRLELNWGDMSAFVRGMAKHCTGSGPSTPVYKRDTTLPAWWTVFHDYCLLRGLETSGHKEYKQIAEMEFVLTLHNVPAGAEADDAQPSSHSFAVALSRPYTGFLLPAKEPGHDWVMDITGSVARVLDKRSAAILKALFSASPCQTYLQEFYRETTATEPVAVYVDLPPLSPMIAAPKVEKKSKTTVTNKLSFGTGASSISSTSFSKFFNRGSESSAAPSKPVTIVTETPLETTKTESPVEKEPAAKSEYEAMVVDLAADEPAEVVSLEVDVVEVAPVATEAVEPAPIASEAPDCDPAPSGQDDEPSPCFPKTPSKPIDPVVIVDSPATITTGIDSAVKPVNPAPAVVKKRAAAPVSAAGLSKKQKLAAGAKQSASLFSFFKKPAAAGEPAAEEHA